VQPIRDDEDRAHPAAYRLDAVAAGDEDERAHEHLASCKECGMYVDTLRQEARIFREQRARGDADAYVARAVERVRRGRRRARVLGVATPLLAAAAFLLLVHGRPPEATVVSSAEPSASPPLSAQTRFKGELSVAVVRERDGRQERIVGPFEVRASDGIRVEVSVDRRGPMTAGLLTDDGAWVVLLAPAAMAPGTHFSERAARFDETPTSATLLVGTPDEVNRARHTRDFAGLVAWRVTSER
jgi:hypothetical protein